MKCKVNRELKEKPCFSRTVVDFSEEPKRNFHSVYSSQFLLRACVAKLSVSFFNQTIASLNRKKHISMESSTGPSAATNRPGERREREREREREERTHQKRNCFKF